VTRKSPIEDSLRFLAEADGIEQKRQESPHDVDNLEHVYASCQSLIIDMSRRLAECDPAYDPKDGLQPVPGLGILHI
jgi:hypothetical protein